MIHIKIGAMFYALKVIPNLVDDDGTALEGHIKPESGELLLSADNPEQSQFFTLWHEALHGIEYNHGLDLGEPLIDTLASAIMEILADNPCMRMPPVPPQPAPNIRKSREIFGAGEELKIEKI